MLKKIVISSLVTALCFALSACGLKGDLYMPDDNAEQSYSQR